MNKRQKVLIVDDEPRNQRIMTEILEDTVDFIVASSGEEALAVIDDFTPDLVMLDIMMPGIDGYAVCQSIRQNPKLILTKIILVSGKAMTEERLKGYEVGADEYMTKPFVAEELLAKAKVFLRLTAMEKEYAEWNRTLDLTVKERTQQLLDAEAKLVNSAKMSALGEMAGGIAHEVNTPLGVITLATDQIANMLNEEHIDVVETMEMVVKIDETVKRISAIIRGLKTFARNGADDAFESVPVKKIIDDALVLCSERLRHHNIELRKDIPDDLTVVCQSVQICQVILNLIGNSCDVVNDLDDKWIEISAEQKDDDVIISITDSGNGIDEKVQDKMFQPFFTTKEIGKGTGLGLSISKGIIDSHHGFIAIDKTSPNTRFNITLPSKIAIARKAS